MEYNINASRLMLYAFIAAVEMDLREFISGNIHETNKEIILDDKLLLRLKERSSKDGQFEVEVNDLIEYLDFGDCAALINKFKKSFPKSFEESINELSKRLQQIVPIRNRVMHSRPLEFEDLTIVIDTIKEIKKIDFVNWNYVEDVQSKIEKDPSYIFGLKIPTMANYKKDNILHNLPPVEFDDTGFIGRKKEREEIKRKLINSRYPISVIGDGGIGKTALVLRCMYDILESQDQIFDAIIWVSLKTRVLNNGEFININNAIVNTFDMYNVVAETLMGKGMSDRETVVNDILEYMKTFKILLVLDNLETINTNELKEFISNIPENSKLIITSRIGIGEFESREQIQGFDKKDRVYYIRRLASTYKVDSILKCTEETLDNICLRLHSNPLAIKWFIINVLKGQSIEKILLHKEDLTEYCMSNVYDKLSAEAKEILEILLIANKKCSDAEIAYLSGSKTVLYRKAINELTTTNMIKMDTNQTASEAISLFYITDFARAYLNAYFKPSNEMFLRITKEMRSLKGLTQNLDIDNSINPYLPMSIVAQNQNECIAACYLRQALEYSSEEEYDKAFEYIEKAKSAHPSYYEIYKVEGFIRTSKKEYYQADQAYCTAMECNNQHAPLMYLYAGFNLQYIEDFDKALEFCKKAEELDPKSCYIQCQKGRILKQMAQYEEAEEIFDISIKSEEFKNQNHKVKQILIDQSIDNLRRWGDKLVKEEHYDKALQKYSKSIQYLENISTSDIDKKTASTLGKVLVAIVYLCFETDTCLDSAINLISETLKKYNSILIYKNSNYSKLNELISGLVPRLSVEQNKTLNEYLEDTILKKVMQLEDDSLGYISWIHRLYGYGFIKSKKHLSGIYFNRQDVLIDFGSLEEGDLIKFTESSNSKGPCAIDISLAKL